MRECPHCKHKTLKLKNILLSRYQCRACGSVCKASSRHNTVGNLLFTLLPVVGVVLAVIFKSIAVLLLLGIIAPLLLCWWHQKTATLYVVGEV